MSIEHTEITGSVDITPTWRGAVQICLMALEDGTVYGKQLARAELQKMGALLDDALPGNAPDVRDAVHPSHWPERAGHPVEDWRDEVIFDDTRLGYLDWVAARIEAGD